MSRVTIPVTFSAAREGLLGSRLYGTCAWLAAEFPMAGAQSASTTSSSSSRIPSRHFTDCQALGAGSRGCRARAGGTKNGQNIRSERPESGEYLEESTCRRGVDVVALSLPLLR
jgi:hypothetical protein